ncbi:YnfC family lipoprotein [Trabulsiella odontotermitis]|uniref:YnfC family lipoprotein n=1 Tax=Trabulsiella odontotermitis TaxID=379893 RepID=UPI0024B7287F|nr:YnfC family lipoprotein [Trabulsiella odontotermitis]WHP29436.1 YnfC family lipoprotein [Trabulsiella odontotermitis]
MKKLLMMAPVTLILAGCDNSSTPAAFTPEMASFSSEFDFDPLRGPVKDFSQTLMDAQGKVSKYVTGKMSEEGCFDLLEFHDLENNTGASLVLDANYYLDAISQKKLLRLQGKCQLAALPASGVTWDTDDNGFVISARGEDMRITYRYDSDGYPLGKTTEAKDEHLSVVATPSKDKRKKMDYTAISTLNDRRIGNVRQSCDYDRHDNPVNCELQIVDESVKPPVTRNYTIKNNIEYY